MAARKPPTASEIIAALKEYDRGRLVATDLTAMSFNVAEKLIKSEFHTTYEKAREWISAALSDPDTDLIALHSAELTDWSTEEIVALRFDSHGRLNLGGRLAPSISGIHITHRDQVPKMRAAIRKSQAEIAAQHERDRVNQRGRIRELHGDSVDVIRAFVNRMNDPTGRPIGDPVEERISDSGGGLTRQAGSPARVSINLLGKQIDAFADLIRAVTQQDSGKASYH